MLARSARQTDIAATVRTSAVNVRFTVFPFVVPQEKPLLDASAKTKVFDVFRTAFVCVSGEHAEKHKNAHGERRDVQNRTERRAFRENGENGQHKINGEHSTRECVGTVSSAEKRRYFLFHEIDHFFNEFKMSLL